MSLATPRPADLLVERLLLAVIPREDRPPLVAELESVKATRWLRLSLSAPSAPEQEDDHEQPVDTSEAVRRLKQAARGGEAGRGGQRTR